MVEIKIGKKSLDSIKALDHWYVRVLALPFVLSIVISIGILTVAEWLIFNPKGEIDENKSI